MNQCPSCRLSLVRKYVSGERLRNLPCDRYVRFSNRPFGVKHFQAIHHCSVDVAHGLVLLFGIGTKALPSWDRRRGGTICWAALPSSERQVQADIRTRLIHRPARDIIPPRGGARVPPIGSDLSRLSCCCRGLFAGPAELGAINPDAVHDHGQSARQRHDCLFNPRRLAICIAQALSHDHFTTRTSMI